MATILHFPETRTIAQVPEAELLALWESYGDPGWYDEGRFKFSIDDIWFELTRRGHKLPY